MSQEIEIRSDDPLERSRAVGTALSVAARKARMSDQSRLSLYQTVGLRPRTSDRVFAIVSRLTFVVAFVVPVAIATAYYGFIATDQYVSEARFTVRTSSPVKTKDKLTEAKGTPSAKIVQDTQIISNNFETAAMVAHLEQTVDLRTLYSHEGIDWFSRLDPTVPREELLEYWEGMVDSEIGLPGGIITLSVRAYRPEDAQRIVQAMIDRSEVLVNELNERIFGDAIEAASLALGRARDELERTRLTLQEHQNTVGVFDIEQEAENIGDLIAQVETEFLELDARYQSNLASVSETAPHMRVMQRELVAKRDQLNQLQARLARAGGTADETSLADFNEQATRLEFERTMAEDRFEEALKVNERLRLLSSSQLMYLDPFLSPTLPETAQYPRRALMIVMVAIVSFLAWMMANVIVAKLRSRFD